MSHITVIFRMLQVMSHDKCGKIVHRPYNSYITSVQNLIGTLSSSPCQLGLKG